MTERKLVAWARGCMAFAERRPREVNPYWHCEPLDDDPQHSAEAQWFDAGWRDAQQMDREVLKTEAHNIAWECALRGEAIDLNPYVDDKLRQSFVAGWEWCERHKRRTIGGKRSRR